MGFPFTMCITFLQAKRGVSGAPVLYENVYTVRKSQWLVLSSLYIPVLRASWVVFQF